MAEHDTMADPDAKTPGDPLEAARNWMNRAEEIAAYYAGQEHGDLLAVTHGAGKQQFDYIQRASFAALVSVAADVRRLADRLTGAPVPEMIGREGDALVCLCGNDPAMSGFDPCLFDGTPVEPVAGGEWDGKLYVCLDCGRVVDQDTLQVRNRRGEQYIRALQDRIIALENRIERLTPDSTAGWSPTG